MVEINVSTTPIGLTVSGDGAPVTVTVSGSAPPAQVELNIGGGIGPAAVYNTALTQLVGVNPISAGKNITITTTGGSYAISASDPPVLTVQGRTGNVVVTLQDVTGAAATHTHDISSVSGLSSALGGKANLVHVHAIADVTGLQEALDGKSSGTHQHSYVTSLNGSTGGLSIVAGANVTVTSSGSSITISSSGSGTTGGSVASVNGKVGTVVLTFTEVSAAAASHSHVAADITNLTNVANVVSVNGRTGTVSLSATDVTAASASHGHSYVTALNGNTGGLDIVAGSNITVSTSGASIVVSGAAGVQGPPGSFSDPQTISTKTASYTLQLADAGVLLTFNGESTSSPISVTVPPSGSVSWVQGSHIDVARLGTAAVSIVAGSGVTVTATPGPALRDKGSAGTLVYLGSDQWLLVGDLDVAS